MAAATGSSGTGFMAAKSPILTGISMACLSEPLSLLRAWLAVLVCPVCELCHHQGSHTKPQSHKERLDPQLRAFASSREIKTAIACLVCELWHGLHQRGGA